MIYKDNDFAIEFKMLDKLFLESVNNDNFIELKCEVKRFIRECFYIIESLITAVWEILCRPLKNNKGLNTKMKELKLLKNKYILSNETYNYFKDIKKKRNDIIHCNLNNINLGVDKEYNISNIKISWLKNIEDCKNSLKNFYTRTIKIIFNILYFFNPNFEVEFYFERWFGIYINKDWLNRRKITLLEGCK